MMRWFAPLWILAWSTGATAEEFKFRAYYFTGGFDACETYAAGLAERFTEHTGHEVLGAGCRYDQHTQRTSIIVRYEAAETVPVVSTHPPRNYYEPHGFYGTRDECVMQIASQEAIFRDETGLEPIVSYCTGDDSRLPRQYPFYHYMIGIGSAERRPFRTSFMTSAPHFPTYEQINEELRTNLADRDINVQGIAWRPFIAHRKATLWGYSNDGLAISSATLNVIPGLEACAVAKHRLTEAVRRRDASSYMTAYCSSQYSGPTRFELNVVFYDRASEVEYSGQEFETIEECQSRRDELADNYARTTGREPVAAICGYPRFRTGGMFRVAFLMVY